MKRVVTVPPAVRAAFVVGLKTESRHAAALPDPLPMGRVLRVIDKNVDTDEEIKVLADQNENGYFLDFYRVDNDGQVAWHARVREDGTVEKLENFQGQFGFPYYADDPEKTAAEEQRILENNARVEDLLKAKGFM